MATVDSLALLRTGDPTEPLGLVLSGGGARGAFQVGVWEVLYARMGRLPDVISGTSAGALNGALIAAGVPPARMLEFWLDLARDPPVIANRNFFKDVRNAVVSMLMREPVRGLGRRTREFRILGSLLSQHAWYTQTGLLSLVLQFLLTARFDTVSDLLDSIPSAYLFDTSPVKQRLVKFMGREDLRNTSVRLAINVIDADTGGVVRIVNHRPDKRPGAPSQHYRYEPVITPDMVLASASIPLLFNPVHLGNQTLWDGGLLVNTPLAPTVALGARRIVPVLVTPRKNESARGVASLGAAIERLADAFLENAYNNDRKLLLDRNALAMRLGDAHFRTVHLFRAIRPETSRVFNAGSYLFFERDAMMHMYDAGRLAARKWLDQGAPLDGVREEG